MSIHSLELLAEEQEVYCLHCGSHRNSDIQMSTSRSKKRSLNPEGKIAGTGGSVGSIENTRSKSIESTRKQCLSCLNLYHVDRVLKPIEIEKEKEIIVIPQHLWVILQMQNYENKDQIIKFIDRYYNKMRNIYNKYKKTGRNLCKRDRLGYKLTLSFSLRSNVKCWVIVEISGAKILYRLCYGGGKIDCQDY